MGKVYIRNSIQSKKTKQEKGSEDKWVMFSARSDALRETPIHALLHVVDDIVTTARYVCIGHG